MDPREAADTVARFFDRHEVSSLKLPAGWFGRPFDNQHRLTSVEADGATLVIRLDEVQILRVHPLRVSADDSTLRLSIQGGDWDWTSYGGTARRHEQLEAGTVEFHA